MARRSTRTTLAAALAVCLAHGCVALAPPVATRGGKPSAAPARPLASRAPVAGPAAAGTTASDAAALVGKVRVTDGGGEIVSDNGSGLLSDFGSRIVSNNGGSMRPPSGRPKVPGEEVVSVKDPPVPAAEHGVVFEAGAALEGRVVLPPVEPEPGDDENSTDFEPGTSGDGQSGDPVDASGDGDQAVDDASSGGSAARRLLGEAPPVPVAGARLELRRADGRLLVGADGAPLVTTTDAAGRFRFAGLRVTAGLALAARLPDGGTRLALVEPGAREVLFDEGAGLLASYLYFRYLDRLARPNAALAALPAQEVAAVRASIAAALAREGGELDVTRIDAWRSQDPALERACAMIARRMADAVLLALGAGGPAMEADMGHQIAALALAPDGSLFVTPSDLNVIWRVRPDGKLSRAVGVGFRGNGPVDGEAAPDAAINASAGLALDAAGRLLMLLVFDSEYGLVRRERDGTLATLSRWGASDPAGLGAGWPTALAYGPGERLRMAMTLALPEGEIVNEEGAVEPPVDGRYVTFEWPLGADGRLGEPARGQERRGRFAPSLDARGTVVREGPEVKLYPPEGPARVLMRGLVDLGQMSELPAAIAADGTVYVAVDGVVWRIAGDRAERFAGKPAR